MKTYAQRVAELEAEGLTTSDAQSAADVEAMRGLILDDGLSAPATHTPGPWTVHGDIGRKSEIGVMADAAPCIIAVMGNQKAWPVEAAANARLIAAAPELLAALERVLQHYEEAVILAGNDPDANIAVCQARAALAKARGG